jgi:hypothetical protein
MRFVQGVCFVVLPTLLTLGIASTSAAEKRVALVIGNAAYQHLPALTAPVNDTRLVARALSPSRRAPWRIRTFRP